MGNHKFRFSDMIPNAWFYKLRDMNSTKKLRSQSHLYNSHQLSSFNVHSIINRSYLPSPSLTQKLQPRKSSDMMRADDKLICQAASSDSLKLLDALSRKSATTKKRTKRKTVYVPSPRKFAGAGDSYNSSSEIELYESPSSAEFDLHENEAIGSSSFSGGSCHCQLCSSSAADIIIDMEERRSSYHRRQDIRIKRVGHKLDLVSGIELPRILTKPTKHNSMEESLSSFRNSPAVKNPNVDKPEKKRQVAETTARISSSFRRTPSRTGRVKIRTSFSGKRSSDVHGRKSNAKTDEDKGCSLFYSDSLAMVKASFDPQKDFRDSMLEMIVENNVRAPKDLEKLLACYLSLNSNQYHDIIIKAFMQIWFNFPDC